MKLHAMMTSCFILLWAITSTASNNGAYLTMEIVPQVKECFLGEDFSLSVIIRNNAKEPLKLLRPCQASIGIGMALGAKYANSNALLVVQADMNILPKDFVVLAPGQSMSNTVALTDIIEPPDKEGIYLFKVTYRSYGPEAFTTQCEAGLFQVTYEMPSGEAKAAWLLFKDRKEKASGLPKKQVLDEIISKYPNTSYAREAKKLLRGPNLKD